ncbi:unnamed protein product [Rotaria sp. Silwood2]|nr:unnamed protein product [Rotaria sp. Silwood2]CAF2775573.1 unnamed protein product [Rotaria sp. Silwood2]CAF3028207.1 unnamed protein product [Rotaria sp. Silwood2]CAF3184217.1 unnamed protein product [Rotaria sp. Silwood2]
MATRRVQSPSQNSTRKYDGYEYQLIPVEIPKDAEIGLVVGHIEGQSWVFIDEILPNGMIDMHGVLKEGDYLIQVGIYSLTNVNITTALLLIERAYDDGRNVNFNLYSNYFIDLFSLDFIICCCSSRKIEC